MILSPRIGHVRVLCAPVHISRKTQRKAGSQARKREEVESFFHSGGLSCRDGGASRCCVVWRFVFGPPHPPLESLMLFRTRLAGKLISGGVAAAFDGEGVTRLFSDAAIYRKVEAIPCQQSYPE